MSADVASLFFRSAGAPLISGNAVRVLLDAQENYPAWLAAVETAQRTIHLEMYIVHNDTIGRRFRDALIAKARAGVAVRLMYDWFGALRPSSFRFWAPLTAAGGQVRVVNPPRPDSLLGLGSRDHRKLLVIDGEVAFIAGLCIGDDWVGNPQRGIAPWRDTGVEVRGPVVAEAEYAFAAAWATWGEGLPPGTVPAHDDLPRAGDVDVRIVPTSPDHPTLYRLELAAIGIAQHRIWLTDAYFMGTSVYIEALSAAARHGVDVRLLLPSNSDVRWAGNLSRTLYRRLLESGVRVFEWNGPMIHAKTAVADGRFVRVGSTNLNVSSWIGNWELDVVVESNALAASMERVYERDLASSTEIVINERDKVRLRSGTRPRVRQHRVPGRRFSRAVGGSANRVLKDVAMAKSVLGSAVRGYRELGPHEVTSLLFFAAPALGLALVGALWPKALAWPIAVMAAIVALSLFSKAWRVLALNRRRRAAEGEWRKREMGEAGKGGMGEEGKGI
jgi:cardiolipin synthase